MRTQSLSREFSEENFGRMVDVLNTFFTKITLADNFNGQILESIRLPADGSDVEIKHNLKVTPKYMIILRQKGVGVTIDGSKEWNSRTIFLRKVEAVSGDLNVPSQNVNFSDLVNTASTTTEANSLTVPAQNVDLSSLNPSDVSDDVTITILLMKG